MSNFFDPQDIRDLDYDHLPALVQKGQDREQVLDGIVEAWCHSHGVVHDPKSYIGDAVDEHVASGGLVLEGVALWDETAERQTDGRPGEPIDLGDLLKRVEERLRAAGAPETFEHRPDLYILLRGCRVYRSNAGGVLIRPRFVSFGVRFDDARFYQTTFGDAANFLQAAFGSSAYFFGASFGDCAEFGKATFGNSASFLQATFGDSAGFLDATFCSSADFLGAKFGGFTVFMKAKFGGSIDFNCAKFGVSVSFALAKFGDSAGFRGAKFADSADFSYVTFGDCADFSEAEFGDSVTFQNANLGDSANFSEATFGDSAKYISAKFGHSADLRGATFGYSANFVDAAFGDSTKFFGAKFGDSADFSYATFGDHTYFIRATIGDSARFGMTKFGNFAKFAKATFGDSASFLEATFGDSAGFSGAKFGDDTGFCGAEFGDDAGFSGARFGASADFERATFGDSADFGLATFGDSANFGLATFGDSANFYRAKFGDSANFRWATLGDAAIFGTATFGDSADFGWATFGDAAIFRGATFGDAASFCFADLRRAGLRDADLSRCDLRDVRGLILDVTRVRDAHFSPRSPDPWSVLRRAYTGPQLIFNLLFLTAFFLPYVARTGYWVGVNRTESVAVEVLGELRDYAADRRETHPGTGEVLVRAAEAVERRVPGPQNPDARRSKVWRLVIGVDRGTWFWVSAVLIVFYNILRAWLTWFVAPMRDEEERSGVSPAYKPTPWDKRPGRDEEGRRKLSEDANAPPHRGNGPRETFRLWPARLRLRVRQYWWACFTRWTEAYGWLIWPHRVARVLFALAIASFAWNAWQWMVLDVWLPPGGGDAPS